MMMTDDEVWTQALAEAECSLGEYPQRDFGKSLIIAIAVFICCVCIHALTIAETTIFASVLIGLSIGGGHFLIWELKRWAYRHRLRSSFWSIRTQEEILSELSEDSGNGTAAN